MTLVLHPIPAFADNYIWALHDKYHCLLVDPGQAEPVQQYIKANALKVSAILITHHHPDHISGMPTLLEDQELLTPSCMVYGPADKRIEFDYQIVCEGDTVQVDSLALTLKVLDVPGHTSTHIAFYDSERLFPGDTLFSAGCGRMFEGTAEQMQQSLDKLAALPDHLSICCAHEYTLDNLRFARAVEPDNNDVLRRQQQVQQLRLDQQPSLPVTLAEERRYNPFLRTREVTVQQAAARVGEIKLDNNEPASVFGVIRHWKDHF